MPATHSKSWERIMFTTVLHVICYIYFCQAAFCQAAFLSDEHVMGSCIDPDVVRWPIIQVFC